MVAASPSRRRPPPPPSPACDCGTGYYPPIAPAPTAYAVAQPVAAPEAPLPRFGIGAYLGGVAVQGANEGQDVGLVGQIRLGRSLLVDGEIAKNTLADLTRAPALRAGASQPRSKGTCRSPRRGQAPTSLPFAFGRTPGRRGLRPRGSDSGSGSESASVSASGSDSGPAAWRSPAPTANVASR
jgi:hypothetical protein